MPIERLPIFDIDGFEVNPTAAKLNELIDAINEGGGGGGGGGGDARFVIPIPELPSGYVWDCIVGPAPFDGEITVHLFALESMEVDPGVERVFQATLASIGAIGQFACDENSPLASSWDNGSGTDVVVGYPVTVGTLIRVRTFDDGDDSSVPGGQLSFVIVISPT